MRRAVSPQLALRIALAAGAIAAGVGFIVASREQAAEAWREVITGAPDAVTPPDLLYRVGSCLRAAKETFFDVQSASWWLRETAVSMYEKLAYTRSAASAHARLRLAVIYGERGFRSEASAILGPVPLQEPSMARVSLLIDWLYGRGAVPADLSKALQDLDNLPPWLVRKCKLKLALAKGRSADAEHLRKQQRRVDAFFLGTALAACFVWLMLVAVGVAALVGWLLWWLFTPVPPIRVRPSPLVRPWSLLDAVEVWAALFAAVVGLKLASGVAASAIRSGGRTAALLDAAGYVLAAGIAVGLILRKLARQPTSTRVLLGLAGHPLRGLVRGLLAYGILNAVLVVGLLAFTYLFGSPTMTIQPLQTSQLPRYALHEPVAAAIYAALAIVVAPLIEEVIFRGFVYAGFRRRFRPGPAIALSAGVFAVTHVSLPLVALMGIALLAMALGYVYERTRDLWVCVGLHAAHNCLVFVLLLLSAL